jgi:hypothetical protein
MSAPVPACTTSTLSANRGLFLIGTNNPEYNAKGFMADLNSTINSVDSLCGVENEVASGAIGIKEGLSAITKAGIAVMTLAAPNAGLPAAGGDDNKELTIKSTTAFAHTITTPANKINGSKLTITFGGAVTDYVQLVAFGGVWYTLGSSGATLS